MTILVMKTMRAIFMYIRQRAREAAASVSR